MRKINDFITLDFKFSIVIIIVNTFFWFLMEIFGGSTSSQVLIRFGAIYQPLVISGQLWRLVSSAFLHIGLTHLAVNSYTLYQLGPIVESFFGLKKFIVVYIFSAIGSSLLSVIFNNAGVSAGASGAIFGLAGLLIGNSFAKKTFVPDLPINEASLLPFVAYNLIAGFMIPGIDNWGHIGGFVTGFLLGYLIDPQISFDNSLFKKIFPEILFFLSLLFVALTFFFMFFSIF